MTSKTFCILPWVHYKHSIMDHLWPCCTWSDPTSLRPKADINASVNITNLDTAFKPLRDSLMNGLEHPGCSRCYLKEQNGIQSLRQKSNLMFKNITENITSTDFYKLQYIEVILDSVCNLTCRMCNSASSSAILPIEKKLLAAGLIDQINHDARYVFDYEDIDFSNVLLIKILGGEPFYSKKMISFLEHLISLNLNHQINLSLSTNGMIINDSILNLLSKFKTVDISISLDGVGIINDYQRTGADFNVIHSNIELLRKLSNTSISFNFTLTLLNVFNLKAFRDYSPGISKTVNFDIFSPISLTKIPLDVRTFIETELITQHTTKKDVDYIKSIYKDQDLTSWSRTLKYIKFLDSYHNTSLSEIHPNLYAFLCNNYNYDSI